VRARRRLILVAGGLLGAAMAVMPALAGSETVPSITAVDVGLYHYWSPAHVSIAPGGSVTLRNPTQVKHGIHWISGPATPQCTGVPVGTTEADSGVEWSGSCTFAAAGTYDFYCTVYGAAMSGSVTVASVEPPATTTTSSSPPPAPESPAYTSPSAPTGAGTPGPGAVASPLLGTAARAIRLSTGPRGLSVRGSVAVSTTGAGGRLEVEVLAHRAELTGTATRLLLVGRTVRRSLASGRVSFSVALDARARRALRARHRLAVSVLVLLTPPRGRAVRVVRSLVLR
jgi:plastocyanin